MSPRRYAMARRSQGVEATRRKIVDAAVRLHTKKGAARTSWDDIAAEAGVSRASVYNHFATLDDLVPACAQVAFDLIEIPSPAAARERFGGMRTPHDRLVNFIEETCRCYGSAAGWLRAAWRERAVVPAMDTAAKRLQRSLRVLLSAALEGVDLSRDDELVLNVLLDFPFWAALDEAGMPRQRIPAHIAKLAEAVVPLR